jgi:hypothetical protein
MSLDKNNKNKRRRRKNRPLFIEDGKCSNKIDVISQYSLNSYPKDDIVVINEEKPYHCAEINEFYKYWKRTARDGQDVRNPHTNIKISDLVLNKIWRKIEETIPHAVRPIKANVDLQYHWNADGDVEELIFPENQEDLDLELIGPPRPLQRQHRERLPFFEPNFNQRELQNIVDILQNDNFDSDNEAIDIDNYHQYGNGRSQKKIMKKVLNIHKQRHLIQKQLEKLGIKDNNDIQKIYIDHAEKKKVLDLIEKHNKELKKYKKENEKKIDLLQFGRGKNKKSQKKIRKHKGINQTTGRLKKGYKYTGEKLKSGLSQIKKVKK